MNSLILFPAIDLKDGKAVRLVRGAMETATVFNDDPAAQARAFAEAGFAWLHLVDLNGAFEGKPVNGDSVAAVRAATELPIQLGGGIRHMATVESWLSAGITRVILGTAALKDPDFVRAACREFHGRVVVGIDARHGRVAVEGWAEESETQAADLARRFEDAGVAAIVFTDIGHDGALQGVNVADTRALADAVTIPVIASGGVASLDDISALLKVESAGIEGAIIGRALYDGRVDASQALALVGAAQAASPC